jgi:hypothetical protein
LFLCLAITAPLLHAVEAPSAETLRSKLHKEHPRLLITPADLDALRRQVDEPGKAADWFAEIRASADKILPEPPSDYVIPDGLRLLATSRRVKERTFTLGLAYQLTRDRKYADRLWKELDAAAHFKDWNPRHFLDTAEMTNAFAIGYDWLYAYWTPEQRSELRDAIVDKGLNAALPIYRKHSWWSKSQFNWNQVCNGGIGMGALALLDEKPELATEILRDGIESIPLAMREFAPDGAWGEGPGYWGYASEYNVYFLAALRTALGDDFGLSQIPGFSKAGEFPPYFTGPTGETFNYADAHPGFHGASQLFWMARVFNSPGQAAFQMRYAAKHPGPLDLIWGAGWLQQHPAEAALPLDRYFRGPEVVTMRSAWGDPKALWVGVKGGSNNVNHGHLDLGSFVMEALGVRWAADLGSDDYNMPGYFGGERWTYYRLRAEAHNTLVINPGRGPDQAPDAFAKVERFGSSRPYSVIDLSSAYHGAKKVERGIALLDRREVLVQDEVDMEHPSEIWWFLHTPAKIEISADGASAVLHQGTAALKAQILGPASAKFEARKAEPLPSSPHPKAQSEKGKSNEEFRALTIHLQNTTQASLRVLLTPDDGKPASTPRPEPLTAWK